jgi:hypothetical protein
MSHFSEANPLKASRLCASCGLCCNGVLFADVKLGSKDAVTVLADHGLPIRRRGGRCAFDQPCVALQVDGHCGVYADRPGMCRAFECGVLQQMLTGQVSETEALHVIGQAQKLARKVGGLLERSGNLDIHRPLARRYQAVMRQPIDLAAGDEAGDLRGELMLAVHALMELLHQRFLRADSPAADRAG